MMWIMFSSNEDVMLIQGDCYNDSQVIGDFTFLLGKKEVKCLCLCNSVTESKLDLSEVMKEKRTNQCSLLKIYLMLVPWIRYISS